MCKSLCPSCSETFSIVLATGKNKYPFPSQLDANKNKVLGIAIRAQNSAGTAKDANGATLAGNDVLAASHISLMRANNKNSLQKIPADYLKFTEEQAMFTCLQHDQLNSNKCELNIASGTTITAGQVVEITIFSDCPPENC